MIKKPLYGAFYLSRVFRFEIKLHYWTLIIELIHKIVMGILN